MTDFTFVPATKQGAYARVALVGPSGSGKTYTALTIAKAFGESVGVIDSENGSAAKYSDEFAFRHLVMTDFDPAKLTAALAAAAEQGINPLIIDSGSHYWEGSGGMLEQVDRAAARSGRGNNFEGWKEMRPVEREMFAAILAYPGHVIMTLRVKTDYVVELNANGKQAPKKVGLRPIQREGIEYEFDVVADMDDARFTVSKSRCPDLTGAVIDRPTTEVGYKVIEWLNRGAVGAPDNPLTIRDWATDEARTLDELRTKYDEVLGKPALSGAPVRDHDGKTYGLAPFIKLCASRVRARIDAAERIAAAAPRERAGANA